MEPERPQTKNLTKPEGTFNSVNRELRTLCIRKVEGRMWEFCKVGLAPWVSFLLDFH